MEFLERSYPPYRDKKLVIEYVNNLPLYTPKELYDKLEKLGYRGQVSARRAVCVAAYRHLRKIKMLFSGRVKKDKIPEKINYLLIGPTGCGKTYIIELLFGKILRLPFVIIDITKYSETGYVGENIINIPARLVEAAYNNVELAQIGVIAFDEFDKIAGARSNVRFAGAGTTKDVSGYGVQRELLKMLEGTKVPYGPGIDPVGTIDTSNMLFFGIGAFSGIKEFSTAREIGFLREITEPDYGKIAYQLKPFEAEDIEKFYSYGFLPELMARFQRIIPFLPLDKKTLKEILHLKLKKLKTEFKEEGFDIKITPRAEEYIIEEAIKRETGARALETVIIRELEEISFEIFGQGKQGKILIDCDKGKLQCKLQLKSKK